jgi:hypothetical protein
MDEDTFTELGKSISYSINLTPMLHKKLRQHLQILKHLRHPEKEQQTWIINAIRQKISRENSSQDISREKYLGVKLDAYILEKLEARLAEIGKTHPGYSKKQWLLDAIEEKLEAEKEAVQKALLGTIAKEGSSP